MNWKRILLGGTGLAAVVVSGGGALAQTVLPEVKVTAPSPIVSRPAPARAPAAPAPTRTRAPAAAPATTPTQPTTPPAETTPTLGVLPIVTDQFATVTVVPNEELRRTPTGTLGDLLFSKPGITGSSFAPGASSRPIIRGLDGNRVGIVENGVGAGGVSDLGEDHFVPINPVASKQVEVIRGPATLRYGSQSIGGIVSATNDRIPDALPCGDNPSLRATPAWARSTCATFEKRGAISSVDNGLEGGVLLNAGGGNFAIHADAFSRLTTDYRIPSYPYLFQPGLPFNGRQPNSYGKFDENSVGGSYIFDRGFFGVAVTQSRALYGIPGIDGDEHKTRINALQTKLTTKGEFRSIGFIDAIRFWGGTTDYKHHEIGLGDPEDPFSLGIRQTFTNKEQEARVEAQLMPMYLSFATLTTAIGVQGSHQDLTAPGADNPGLFDPNSNKRIAGFIFNEFKFSEWTKAQIAGRIERVDLTGFGRTFPDTGGVVSTPASLGFTPKSASFGLIQNFAWDLVGSITAQYVERAPKPAELFSGGPHDATETFDKGNTGLKIEVAKSVEIGLRRATAPFRFEVTAYYTRFNNFIFRNLTGNTCDGDTAVCGPGAGDLNEAIYSQRDAIFRGGEFQSQLEVGRLFNGIWGIENQFDIVRATFTDGSNVPRIPPVRVGGGLFWRDSVWLARVNLLHAFAQNLTAPVAETPTAGYNLLKAELSYTKKLKPIDFGPKEITVGVVGNNLLNEDIRNSVSYTKDVVLLPGATVKLFANWKF